MIRRWFFLQRKLSENSALISNMQQFGPVLIDRGGPEDVDIDLCHLPFRSRSSASQEPHSEPLEEQLFVGIDYGRSDIKTVVVDASDRLLAKYVTRWWRIDDSGVLEYVDPQVLTSHKCHVQCLAEAAIAALQQVKDFSKKTVCGVGISAAGCVKYGKLCGIPPAMGGVEDTDATRQDLENLEGCVLEEMRKILDVKARCTSVLVNDGDASALYGASGMPAGKAGLFLSCGTGLAGGVVWKGDSCDGILELGKLVVGLPDTGTGGVVPVHDGLNLPAAAQGMCGTQRAFFNLLAARGGDFITGKAEQRAALVAMQKKELDADSRGLFESLGQWLACFVMELNEYLPVKVNYVEAGGKVTDGPTGEAMLEACRQALPEMEVRKALDSEFGQAVAVASLVRPQG
ncbi:unnamed protein product [Durusdinium trenchii]|uniref:ROK family protein n=1 Tax=Durusdinium trenchii TaxID=1381693 RepID=A0ABP0KKB0_9DINO